MIADKPGSTNTN